MNTLRTAAVSSVLDDLFADAARVDPQVLAPFAKLPPDERAAMLRDYKRLYGEAKTAYLPVSRRVGELLYLQARARDAGLVVEAMSGVAFDPLRRSWRLAPDDLDVNYMLAAGRPGTTTGR